MIEKVFKIAKNTSPLVKPIRLYILKGEFEMDEMMPKLPAMAELTPLVNQLKESIVILEALIEISKIRDPHMTDKYQKRLLLSKQLVVQLALANNTIKTINILAEED